MTELGNEVELLISILNTIKTLSGEPRTEHQELTLNMELIEFSPKS